MHIGDRRDFAFMKKDGGGQSLRLRRSRVAVAIFVGLLIACVFALFYLEGFFVSSPPLRHSEVITNTCESPERFNILKLEFVAALERMGMRGFMPLKELWTITCS